MSRRQRDDCLSDLKLDCWLAGELTLAEQHRAALHLEACEACQKRRTQLLESRESFTRDAPAFAALTRKDTSSSEAGTNSGQQRPGQSNDSEPESSRRRSFASRWAWSTRSHWLGAGSALAAAAAVALLISKPWGASAPASGPAMGAGTRTKGGLASLSWVVRRGGRVFAGRPEQRLRAGDAVRFLMSAREPVYVAVVGLDAGGRASTYFSDGDQLARIEAGRDQPLPAAIELDAAPVALQVYAVFCSSPTPVSGVTTAIENSPDTPLLPRGCTLERSALQKEIP